MKQILARSPVSLRRALPLLALLPVVACSAKGTGAPADVGTRPQSNTGADPPTDAGTHPQTNTGSAATRAESNTTDAATTLPACTLPSGYDGTAAGSCRVGRALMDCTSPEYGSGCLADAIIPCESAAPDSVCEDRCEPGEYAMSCGTIGPPQPGVTVQTAPETCRTVAPTPGGIVFYCCPCG